jgi:hypothetical protein
MKIKVVKDEIPKSLWVYLNLNDAAVAWACYRGVLFPSEFYIKSKPGLCPLGWRAYTILKYAAESNNKNIVSSEVILEDVRRRYYPDKVSRLTGMFAFLSRESAIKGKSWGVGHFEEEFLVELNIDPLREYTVVDSSWFTRYANEGLSEDVAHAYWSGRPNPEEEQLWEVLFDSPASICGTEVRMKCLELFRRHMPQVLPVLDLARRAVELGFTFGTVFPLLSIKDDVVRVSFYIDMEDINNEDLQKADRQYAGPRLSCGSEDFVLLNLSHRDFELDSNEMLTLLKFLHSGKYGLFLH